MNALKLKIERATKKWEEKSNKERLKWKSGLCLTEQRDRHTDNKMEISEGCEKLRE